MKKVSIVGGGFSGMTIALRLAELGFSVDLYEKSNRLGGLLGTEVTPWGLAEHAANALIRTESVDKLFRQLEIPVALPKKSSRKRFFFRGRPRTWPLTIGETWSAFKSLFKKLILEKSSLRPQPGETLQSWALKIIGKTPSQFVLEPALQGIYANELADLSASLILSPLFRRKKKNKKYRGLMTGSGGMQDVVNGLERVLREKGVRIHLNSAPQLELLLGPVVLALPASGAAAMTSRKYPALSKMLGRIRMSTLVSATLFFDKPQKKYLGFGCLIPRGLGLQSLGVLMNSSIFNGRDQTYNETWILGGKNAGSLLSYSDISLLNLIESEREQILGSKSPILGSRIFRWENALPAYDTELEIVLRELELPDDLYLHGNYLAGIGLSKILERSQLLANELNKNYG